MAESKTSESRLQAAENQRQALTLRTEGRSFEYIAAKLGYKGPSGAYQAVMRGLKRTLQEPADELRQLETERLDVMQAALWPSVQSGDPQAVDKALKVMERRAKLLGLDAPTKIAPTDPSGANAYEPLSLDERLARLGAILDRAGARRDRSSAGDASAE